MKIVGKIKNLIKAYILYTWGNSMHTVRSIHNAYCNIGNSMRTVIYATSNKTTVVQHEQTKFSDIVPVDNSQSSPE